MLLLVGSANRDEAGVPRRPIDTTSTATPPGWSASAVVAISAWEPRWPGWRRAWASASWSKRVASLRRRSRRDRAGPLDQRPRPVRPSDHGRPSADASLRTQSRRPPRRGDRSVLRVSGRRRPRPSPPSVTRWCSGPDGLPSARRPRRRSGPAAVSAFAIRLDLADADSVEAFRRGRRGRPRSCRDPGVQCGAERRRCGARHRSRARSTEVIGVNVTGPTGW